MMTRERIHGVDDVSILRVYDPPECDGKGDPLGWECCRNCGGSGEGRVRQSPDLPWEACASCEGHGSLKAAALASRLMRFRGAVPIPDDEIGHRCEDCNHPMSEGTWEWRDAGTRRRLAVTVPNDAKNLGLGLKWLREGREPKQARTHYSPCDEGCRHHALTDCRAVRDGEVHPYSQWSWDNGHSTWPREASWRQVDIRRMGWPHDLRPERLAILCTRCYAERTKT